MYLFHVPLKAYFEAPSCYIPTYQVQQTSLLGYVPELSQKLISDVGGGYGKVDCGHGDHGEIDHGHGDHGDVDHGHGDHWGS